MRNQILIGPKSIMCNIKPRSAELYPLGTSEAVIIRANRDGFSDFIYDGAEETHNLSF